MEQKHISLEEIYYKLLSIERALEAKGIIIEDDEGELTEEYKERLKNARKTPLSEYVDHNEVKKRILAKR